MSVEESDSTNLPGTQEPGTWSSGAISDENLKEEWDKQESEAKSQKERLIQEKLKSGEITPQYAELLERVDSSTFGGKNLANLIKVESAIGVHNQLENKGIDQGPVAYIASGLDWEFPVALGARDIDMVDLAFAKEESGNAQRELLDKIKNVDPNVTIDEGRTIKFGVDLGKGKEIVTLRLLGIEADDYEPTTTLKGVIEFNGPHGMNTPLVREKMVPHLAKGSQILNFDFHKSDFNPPGATIQALNRVLFYTVDDPATFGQALAETPKVPEIDLGSIRAQLNKSNSNDY